MLSEKPSTLCLSGWAQPHDALEAIAPGAVHLDYSDCATLEAVFARLCAHGGTDRLIGWSLGGWLSLRAVAEGHIRTRQLVLLAPPLQFVACEDFPHGMPRRTFEQFYHNYQSDPARAARRFAALIARGDEHHTRITKTLGQWAGSADAACWQPWLGALEGGKHHHVSAAALPPTLLIHGQQDSIVSVEQAHILAKRLLEIELHILPDAAHAPHLHDAAAVKRAMGDHAARHSDCRLEHAVIKRVP